MNVEEIDLAVVTEELRRRLPDPLEGFVRGRTIARDAVATQLGCSELEAERLVDTMIGRGFLRFSGDAARATEGGVWRFATPGD